MMDYSTHTYSQDGVECPYCGRLHTPDDTDYSIYREENTEYECHDCGKTFGVYLYVTHSWTCNRIE